MRKAFLVAFIAGILSLAVHSASAGQRWDVASDFSIDNGNPNGAWSYGWMDGSTFQLYTSIMGDQGWSDIGTGNIWKNVSTSTEYGVQPGQVSLHPGPSYQASVVRWTAPEAYAAIDIDGQFFPGDWGAMQVAVLLNENWTSSLWNATDYGAFDLAVSVSAGDTIDFAVYGGYDYGNTPLEAMIIVPEPSCVVLAITGLLGALAYAWRWRGKKGQSFRVVCLVAVGLCVSLPSLAVAGNTTYDYVADFSNDNGNPNGAWSYGAKYKDGQGKPTGAFKFLDTTDDDWTLHWYLTATEGDIISGETWRNDSANTEFNILPGHCSLNGDYDNTSTARWTSLVEGHIDLVVSLGSSLSARMIMHNDSVLADGSDVYTYSAQQMYVAANDTIDVTAYSAPWSGNTQTDITITFTPVPEPGSLAMLAGIALTALLYWWRKHV